MRIFSGKWFHTTGKLLFATVNGFIDDNGLKYSASLAYYTVFSIAPLMLLLAFIVGIYFGPDAFSGQIYPQLKGFVGADAATQIQNMIKNMQMGRSSFTVIIGIVTVLVGASGVFLDMQDSLNIIWRVKAKPKRGWVKMLVNRLLSFSLVIGFGFLMLVSLIINTLVDALSTRLSHYFHDFTILVFNVVNQVITFLVTGALFTIIFKFLPDVKIQWRNGGFFYRGTVYVG
jgi:membrane protein